MRPSLPVALLLSIATYASAAPTAADLAQVTGSYRLDGGARLDIAQQDQRLYASINNGRAIALTPTGPTSFVSADHTFLLRYDPVTDTVSLSLPGLPARQRQRLPRS